MCFSPDGCSLLSVEANDEHTHVVWRDSAGGWSQVEKVSFAPGNRNAVCRLMSVLSHNSKVTLLRFYLLHGLGVKVMKI
jgi:hypothetical protein